MVKLRAALHRRFVLEIPLARFFTAASIAAFVADLERGLAPRTPDVATLPTDAVDQLDPRAQAQPARRADPAAHQLQVAVHPHGRRRSLRRSRRAAWRARHAAGLATGNAAPHLRRRPVMGDPVRQPRDVDQPVVQAIEHLRAVCHHVGAVPVPGAVSLAQVHRLFDASGGCSDADLARLTGQLAGALVTYARALGGSTGLDRERRATASPSSPRGARRSLHR
jgi:hypothetical protein